MILEKLILEMCPPSIAVGYILVQQDVFVYWLGSTVCINVCNSHGKSALVCHFDLTWL